MTLNDALRDTIAALQLPADTNVPVPRFNPHFINIAVSGFEKHDDVHKNKSCYSGLIWWSRAMIMLCVSQHHGFQQKYM